MAKNDKLSPLLIEGWYRAEMRLELMMRIKGECMENRYMSVRRMAEYLDVSESAIRKWIRCGRIPFVKINGSIRFDSQIIDRWLLNKTRRMDVVRD